MRSTTLPLSPIEKGFEETIRKTVDQYDTILEFVDGVVGRGLRNVFFVGAGGSLIAGDPAYYTLVRTADLPIYQVQSDELNTAKPSALGVGSLVVLASYTGTTKETVAAATYAQSTGASVVAVGKAGSPLAEAADLHLTGSSDIAELMVAYAVLEASGVAGDYPRIRAAFEALPQALLVAQEEYEEHLRTIAAALKDEEITYVLGSGPSAGWAYGLAMCFLQEMQWMNALSFNSGEFFQGAFETVTENTAVILILGEDASRPMGERARAFLETYTTKAHYVDVSDLTLPGVPADMRPLVSPLAVAAVIGRLAKHYEAVRGHSLEQRRYMFRVEY